MSCSATRPLLALHPDPDESPEVRAGIDAHLAACPACAAEARRLRGAWELLTAVPPPDPGPEFARRVRRAVDARRTPRILRAWTSVAAAAAVLLAAVAFYGVARDRRPITLPAAEALAGVAPADVEVVENLDVLRDLDVIESYDLLVDGGSVEDAAGLIDLAPREY